MRVVVVEPPAPVVTLAQAKAQLRVEDSNTDDDTLITGLVAAATRGLDGPDGWLGRALGAQKLCAYLAPEDLVGRYRRGIDLPFPPCRSQDAMAVTEVNPGAGPALGAASYSLDGAARTLRFGFGSLPWGETTAVTYVTGSATLADEVRAAILLLVGSLYANREADVIDARAVVAENPAVERLLSPLRIWRT